MSWAALALFLLGLWLLLNLVAPYSMLARAERCSPGRLPAELLKRGEARSVYFYVGPTAMSYAVSLWAPGLGAVVVFNADFFRRAPPDLVRWVVAHELGHAAHNHHIIRWLFICTGAVLFPWVRRELERHEQAADIYARLLTGIDKEKFAQYLT